MKTLVQKLFPSLWVLTLAVACGDAGESEDNAEFFASRLPQVGGLRYYEILEPSCGQSLEETLSVARSTKNYISFEGEKFTQVDTSFLSEGCQLITESKVEPEDDMNFYISDHRAKLVGEACGSSRDEELLEFNRMVWDSLGKMKLRYRVEGRVLRLTYLGEAGCLAYVRPRERSLEL